MSCYNRELWAVDSQNNIFSATVDVSGTPTWTQISGSYISVFVGSTQVWAINSNHLIDACTKPCTGVWTRIPGIVSQISFGVSEVWATNSAGSIFKSTVPFSSWTPINGLLTEVSVGKNFVYGVNQQNTLFSCANPCTGNWQILSQGLSQISADLFDGVAFGLTTGNALQRWDGTAWAAIAAPQISNICTLNQNEIIAITPTGNVLYGKWILLVKLLA